MGRTLDALRAADLRRAERLASSRGPRRFRLIAVASNKGGVGKTTFAIHLAVYLRALHEDLPLLVFALDDQTLIERTLAVGAHAEHAGPGGPTIADALRGQALEGALRAGQYGISYVPAAPQAEALRPLLADPGALDRLLRGAGVEGVVIVDTKSELGPPTRAAVAAADLVVAPARDAASLAEAEKVIDLLPAGARERFHVLLSGVDLRIKFEAGEAEDLLALLLTELRRRGLAHFPTFLSRSPLVEALATTPGGPPRTVLHAAPRSLVHRQMTSLAREVMDALEAQAPFGAEETAPAPEPQAERLRDLARWLLQPRGGSEGGA
jgi:cellulose biosynthesis protein BcsQ